MISEGIKKLANLPATSDMRVDALVPWFAEQIAALRFNNPDAIALQADLDLARKLIEPLRKTLVDGFERDKAIATERERCASLIETMGDGPISTKAVKSYLSRLIRDA